MQIIHFKKLYKSLYLFIGFALLQIQGHSQRSIQVNSIDEFTLRDLQMLSGWSPSTSFAVRPLFVVDSSNVMKLLVGINQRPKWEKGNIKFYANPLDITLQGNSHSNWGRNNGSFLSVKGHQQKISTGFKTPDNYFENFTVNVNEPVRTKKTKLFFITKS